MQSPGQVAIVLGQECLRESPVIVLGSGASIPFGLPSMNSLASHILCGNPDISFKGHDLELWEQFIEKLSSGHDLETALANSDMSDGISKTIVERTWKCISSADSDLFTRLLSDQTLLPLTRLFQYLFDSTNHTVSVVTTNYDRLAEYAADSAGFCHFTGFTYGFLRRRQSTSRIRFSRNSHPARTIDIWKVHGSIDWFLSEDDSVVALPSAHSIPINFRPAIVTPGVEKYERTHQEPFRSVITGADNALSSAKAYLCIGFGFNDSHIQPKLRERWRQGEALLVILAKELTPPVKEMLGGSKGQHYLALEEASEGTMMWSHLYPDGVMLEDMNLWDLGIFLQSIL